MKTFLLGSKIKIPKTTLPPVFVDIINIISRFRTSIPNDERCKKNSMSNVYS